jgi:hypothetical protein
LTEQLDRDPQIVDEPPEVPPKLVGPHHGRRMHGRHRHPPVRHFHLPPTVLGNPERRAEECLRGHRPHDNQQRRLHDLQFTPQPRVARRDLAGRGCLVDPPLSLPLEPEVLHGIRQVDGVPLDPGVVEGSTEEPPRRSDERLALLFLQITRLLPDHHQLGVRASVAEDRARSVLPQIAAATTVHGLRQRGDAAPIGQIGLGALERRPRRAHVRPVPVGGELHVDDPSHTQEKRVRAVPDSAVGTRPARGFRRPPGGRHSRPKQPGQESSDPGVVGSTPGMDQGRSPRGARRRGAAPGRRPPSRTGVPRSPLA